MRKLKTITVAFLFIFSLLFVVFNVNHVQAVGTTRYVATTGNDATGDGSIGNPYKTIQKGVNVSTTAGDILYIRGGNYNEMVYMKASGTAGNPITISGYSDERAVLDGTGVSVPASYGLINLWSGGATVGRKYITIQNLAIENSTQMGIRTLDHVSSPSNNITVTNCTFSNIKYNALDFIQTFSTPKVSDITISHCSFNEIQVGLSLGECTTFYNCVNVVFENNYMDKCHKIMIDIANESKSILINNNRFKTESTAIYLDAVGYTISNVIISNNSIWGNRTGITLANEWGDYHPGETQGQINNVTIENNVINISGSNAVHGIFFNYASQHQYDVTIKYNTLYKADGAGNCIDINLNTGYLHRFIVANNILISGGSTNYQLAAQILSTSSELTRANNLYYHTSKAPNTNFGDGTNKFEASAVKANPEFVSLPTYDFHLNQTSPAIDAASSTYTVSTDYDGNLRPMGLGYDIGAYEVGPSSIIITSDSDFNISNGVRYGSGTTASPYMISNWTVYNVSISGTTKNFTIKDCTIIHHVLISGLSASSNLLWSNVIMDGAGHIPLSYIYLTHTLSTFTNSKFYNLSYSYMKNG